MRELRRLIGIGCCSLCLTLAHACSKGGDSGSLAETSKRADGAVDADGSLGDAGQPEEDAMMGGEARSDGNTDWASCLGETDPNPLDTDNDGLANACDPDDDGDGFDDADDPEPLDPTVPGEFGTPEAILNNAKIQAALEAATDAGLELPIHLEDNPVLATQLVRYGIIEKVS